MPSETTTTRPDTTAASEGLPRVPLRYISGLPSETWRTKLPRSLAILGSTGSIGRSALDVIALQPEKFHVAALAGATNMALLAKQAEAHRPDYLGVLDENAAKKLRPLLPAGYKPTIVHGQQGYEALARLPGVGCVLSAQVGAAGLRATYAAAQAGKVIALANKESLVLAGDLIRASCARTGASVLPVDSEHNAIFQCLCGNLPESAQTPDEGKDAAAAKPPFERNISRLILTASGGPFFGKQREELESVTPEQALAHPNWTMGAKITIDSATMMNKGLEIIEAGHLFGVSLSAIEVLIHRESIIHSLVEFADGSLLAQLGQPDMRVPIGFCLAYPRRAVTGVRRLDLAALATLSFHQPDKRNFPCLALAAAAVEHGRGGPVILNAANEIAVASFLEQRIAFMGIPQIVAATLEQLAGQKAPVGIDEILELDALSRNTAETLVRKMA